MRGGIPIKNVSGGPRIGTHGKSITMDLKEELKQHLIEQLNLEGMLTTDIEDDKPLFGDNGLGLDSIDALEIIVLLDNHYGIALTSPEEGRQVFKSINSLAEYIEKRRS